MKNIKTMADIHPKFIPFFVAIAAVIALVVMQSFGAPPEMITAVLWSANGMLSMWVVLSLSGHLK